MTASWRPARSLTVLQDQINQAYPHRSKVADGMIGDARHQAEPSSDHNPALYRGEWVVCAFDITHDPAHGVNIGTLADTLARSRDPRIKYMIVNGLILDTRPQFNPWKWVSYQGSSAHREHLHVSVLLNRCDNTAAWDIGTVERTSDMPLTPGEIQTIAQAVWDRLSDDDDADPNTPSVTIGQEIKNMNAKLNTILKRLPAQPN